MLETNDSKQIRARAMTIGDLEGLLAHASVSEYLGTTRTRAWLYGLQSATGLTRRSAEDVLRSRGILNPKVWALEEYRLINEDIRLLNEEETRARRAHEEELEKKFRIGTQGLERSVFEVTLKQEELEEKKFRVEFPFDPGTYFFTFLSRFGKDGFLRWFLRKTQITKQGGEPISFEAPGLKIQTARALLNLVNGYLREAKGDRTYYIKEAKVLPQHRFNDLYSF